MKDDFSLVLSFALGLAVATVVLCAIFVAHSMVSDAHCNIVVDTVAQQAYLRDCR